MEASVASSSHAAPAAPRPGLPGYADDDFVPDNLIGQAHQKGDRTVRNWRTDGLPFIKVGQQVLVRVGDYRGWLLSRKVRKGGSKDARRKRRAA